MSKKMTTFDGNSAVAHVAHMTNEVVAIYPITPSSDMASACDLKSAAGEKNIFGTVPEVIEMQSEGGAAGAVHGALTTGALTTTFTASQGLLLMIPNMYKIAGELTSTVFHVSARAVAASALSIFGDHSDVMATRATGYAMLSSCNVQEAMDFALISQQATLRTRVPFIHFFDGFRTSHELQKIEEISREQVEKYIDRDAVRAHKKRGLNPENPQIRGTAQNPDVYFQGREAVNKFYNEAPAIVQKCMDEFAQLTGRKYNLFDYVGAPDAENIIIVMGSGADTVHETVEYLNSKGEKVGVLKIRLFRPFDIEAFMASMPKTVKKIAVLDRTKEPGSVGEPLYEDVRTAIGEAMAAGLSPFSEYPVVLGGRFGLGSKEFNPSMVKSVFDNLEGEMKNHFTVGIKDDVTNSSLDFDPTWNIESDEVFKGLFYGLGSDGTVGANKNTIKIISTTTDNYAQGYFVYDSKKAGSVTTSHVRFGKKPIRSTYLIKKADFMAVHNFSFFEKISMLRNLKENGTLLINSFFKGDELWDKLPCEVQEQILEKNIKVYTINAYKIGEEIGLGARINMIMQTAFFKISEVIDVDLAIKSIKDAIVKTYGKKGEKVVNMNISAVDASISGIEEVKIPGAVSSKCKMKEAVPSNSPEFVKNVTAKLIKLEGDDVPVGDLPCDGTWPTATTQYEKRNIATSVPAWKEDTCIQCNQCVMICPHAVLRPAIYDKSLLEKAPATFKHANAKIPGKDTDLAFTIQVSVEDCTGCGNCERICPTKEKSLVMSDMLSLRAPEKENWEFFKSTIPETDRTLFAKNTLKGSQFRTPLFEFSGACAGCGETPYIKLMTQLFGDRAIIGNATGCTSIYSGNLPTTPYCQTPEGKGPAWSNSLFEDNAEFALGMRLTADKLNEYCLILCENIIAGDYSDAAKKTAKAIIDNNEQATDEAIQQQRKNVADLKAAVKSVDSEDAKEFEANGDYAVKKSVWAVGGDGWAYDIGFGGLDHVIASGKNVNILVVDTEVYSNTGGQASKSTPKAGVAQFAAGGKKIGKKDLGLIATTYGYVYVARIAIGANPAQAIKAFAEAEAFDGPSIIIAYSPCIAHGIDLKNGVQQQKHAVNSGHWILFRYNPELIEQGKNPLVLDSKDPSIDLSEYYSLENRFSQLMRSNPETYNRLIEEAKKENKIKYNMYKALAAQQES